MTSLKYVHTENATWKSIITSLSGKVGGRCWYQAVVLHTPVHTMLNKGTPVCAKPWRLAPECLKIAKQEFCLAHFRTNLSQDIATEITDLLINHPAENPYDVLKETLITRTIHSEQQQLQQLHSAEDLGDQKHTQLLRKMQQLIGDKAEAMDPSHLKGLFIQRLPSNIRMILASTAKGSNYLQELAEMADSVMEVISPSIAMVAPPQTTELGKLKTEVASLRRQLSDL